MLPSVLEDTQQNIWSGDKKKERKGPADMQEPRQSGRRVQMRIWQRYVLPDHELHRNRKAPGYEHLPKHHGAYERQTSYTVTGLFAVLS